MVWTKLGLTKQRLNKLHFNTLKKLHLSKRHYLIAGTAVLLLAALEGSAVAMWCYGTDPVTVQEHTRIHVDLDHAVYTNTRTEHHVQDTISKPVLLEAKT